MSSDDEDGPMENGLAAADSEEDKSDSGVDEKAASCEEEESEEAESSDEDDAEADVDAPAAVEVGPVFDREYNPAQGVLVQPYPEAMVQSYVICIL